MPRQTYATREFFLNTLETTAHETVLDLPLFFSKIRLLAQNLKLHCVTFLYEQEGAFLPIHIAISVLPLDSSHTKVTVHGSYTNGCAFYKDPYVTNAVANVEAALQAAISGCTHAFEPVVPKKKFSQRCMQLRTMALSSISTGLKKGKVLKPLHA